MDVSNNLQKRGRNSLKEKTQYGLTFGVIAMMLFVAGFPMVVIFFFGIFAYFLWKTFSSAPKNSVNQIFEFYISANSILRDDERRWFGFEVEEAINRGERILGAMHGAPPLVYYALGALYHKIGNHDRALTHLSYVVEDKHANEASYVHPSIELRKYVEVLRKIEREPSDAPIMSAAIRALERSRKYRGEELLEDTRENLRKASEERKQLRQKDESSKEKIAADVSENILLRSVTDPKTPVAEDENNAKQGGQNRVRRKPSASRSSEPRKPDPDDLYSERKPITEVLHDIYDKNIQ